jgi:hypothetical protein
MGSFLERLQVESVPGLYSREKFGHRVKACLCVPSEGAPTLLDGELAYVGHYSKFSIVCR